MTSLRRVLTVWTRVVHIDAHITLIACAVWTGIKLELTHCTPNVCSMPIMWITGFYTLMWINVQLI